MICGHYSPDLNFLTVLLLEFKSLVFNQSQLLC